VRFYGVVDVELREAVEHFAAEDEAVRVLPETLSGEPEWEGRFVVRPVDLFVGSLN
jgi:hypothetical protein